MIFWGDSSGCYPDFSTASDTVSHIIIVDKAVNYMLDSEVGWKLTEQLGWGGCDQWYKV